MTNKQVVYFYEGETEKKLLRILKKTKKIKHGKSQKFNLWTNNFNAIKRKINKKDKLFFIVDTDQTREGINTFIKNIKCLKQSYKETCFIFQKDNLEEELCFSCEKRNKDALFNDFYNVSSTQEFKKKFINESNLNKKLNDNSFDLARLWSRANDFNDFLEANNLSVNVNCNIKL